MAFAAIDVLGVVAAALLAAGGRIDRLAVHAGRGPGLRGLFLRADLSAERVVDVVQGTVVPPLVEVAPDGGLGREVLGQVAPLAAGPQDVEDGVHHLTQVGLAGAAAGVHRDQPLDQPPLRVGHIAGVLIRSHPNDLRKSPLMGQSLSHTTAVRLYPHAASPVGALELVGNVWDWYFNE